MSVELILNSYMWYSHMREVVKYLPACHRHVPTALVPVACKKLGRLSSVV